jgi:hypothetical protein
MNGRIFEAVAIDHPRIPVDVAPKAGNRVSEPRVARAASPAGALRP